MRFIYFLIIVGCMACAPHKTNTNYNSSTNLAEVAASYTQRELRGTNTPYRNWWNVLRYNLVLTPNYDRQYIMGTNTIEFEVTGEGKLMQIDMQDAMEVTKIVQLLNPPMKNKIQEEWVLDKKYWTRLDNAIFIDFQQLPLQKKENKHILKIYFEGKPRIARNAPWDGGWVFTKDDKGRPWMSAAVQGLGASAWFPCKDYQGDEPDNGMTFTMIVPEDLVAVANGKLWETSFVKGEEGSNVYTWEVRNPINSYNIIPYVGHYVQIQDTFMGKKGVLPLDYWVLDYNIEKAKLHFKQVKPMLSSFEDWMGPYPFYEDGYKLVESPYLGMEHQSAIAYGNNYKNGYLGADRSGSGSGEKFDFIIVHESGHEWFGNSITTKDIADMWVHEGFTTYSEVMYVESQWGKKAAESYLQGLRSGIYNRENIIGTYGVNSAGSSDMYNKGANIIHTLRHWMNDDVKFKNMIRAINKEFYHKTVTSQEIEDFIADYTGFSLDAFFNSYLRSTKVPTLDIKKKDGAKYYKWTHVADGFQMPLKLNNSSQWIYPTADWKRYEGEGELNIDPNFYIYTK